MAKTCTYCPLGEGEAILENLIVTEVWLIPVFPHPAPSRPDRIIQSRPSTIAGRQIEEEWEMM